MKGYVLLGIALLVAMFIGGSLLFSGSAANDKKKHDAEANTPPDKVVCWGYFDGEKGVAGLDPKQFGDVIDVVPENTKVTKGTVLLQIDDTITKLKVKAAQLQLAEAKHLTELYKQQAIEFKSSFDAILNEANKDLDRIRKNGSPAQVKEAEDLLDAKKKTAAAKLEQIKLQDAPLKIAQAENQLKEAEAMLKYFQVVAPDDGTVLRVNVRKGETLAPTPMRHAVEFLPKAPIIVKAEVLQEWGRYIDKDQAVTIEDDTYKGPKWEGTVKSVSEWYAPTRSPVIEPFRYNDVRTLECIIELKDTKDATVARIGQRVRAKIDISKK
jgi:multidrug efflux pump subunit AcrA (membrane-fusion protein)